MNNFTVRKDFDEKENLIFIENIKKTGIYHSNIEGKNIHNIVLSSEYAKQLICTGQNVELGEKIIEKVISLQDKDSESKTYGLWAYYMEESLAEMYEPDKNMAGFNSRNMVEILEVAGDRVSAGIKEEMMKAISRACILIMKRNEGVQYTNVSFLESLVLCWYGSTAGDEKIMNAGRNKLKKALGFINYHGSVFEHNSPHYSFHCVNDLGRFLKYIKDEKALGYAREINYYMWKCLAEHFDYKNLQIGGPHSRSYSDYFPVSNLGIIMSACGLEENYKNHPMAPEDLVPVENDAICPDDLIPYFSGEKVWGNSRRIIIRGFNYPFFAFNQTITHYRGDSFTLGTFNREELWNQRRPFVSYIDGEKKPYCFRIKCFHDSFDFSSAVLHCVQKEGKVLGNVNFSSDRGDTHIGLDLIKNTTIEAEDLRIIFEVIGDIGNCDCSVTADGADLKIGKTPVRIRSIYNAFGDYPVSFETEKTDEYLRYSIVLYHGEKTKINFGKFEEAISAFAIEIGELSEKSEMKTVPDGDYLNTVWETDEDVLMLHTLKNSQPFKVNMYEDKQYINGEELFAIIDSEELINV